MDKFVFGRYIKYMKNVILKNIADASVNYIVRYKTSDEIINQNVRRLNFCQVDVRQYTI